MVVENVGDLDKDPRFTDEQVEQQSSPFSSSPKNPLLTLLLVGNLLPGHFPVLGGGLPEVPGADRTVVYSRKGHGGLQWGETDGHRLTVLTDQDLLGAEIGVELKHCC